MAANGQLIHIYSEKICITVLRHIGLYHNTSASVNVFEMSNANICVLKYAWQGAQYQKIENI